MAAFPSVVVSDAESLCTEVLFDLMSDGQGGLAALPDDRVIFAAVWRRTRAEVRSERARRQREERWVSSNMAPHDWETGATEDHARAHELLGMIMAALPDDSMRVTFRLWLKGERRVRVYAAALGIPMADRRHVRSEVKRHRDRLAKCLRRNHAVRVAAQSLQLE